MNIIKLKGGLGNQMFQYAFAKSMVEKGLEIYLDDRDGNKLKAYFNVDIPSAALSDVKRLGDTSYDVRHRIRRKIFGIKKSVYIDKEYGFQNEVYSLDNKYFEGYWQSEKYFVEIKEEISQVFQMKNHMTLYQQEVLDKIESCEAVGVHIRRGDYLQLDEMYGNICTPGYYKQAMDSFAGLPDIKFFIFSNDYEFCKERYNYNNVYVVKSEDDLLASNMDMYLMSRCKHNIIANSSFSWWGAWLNSNASKIVIAPKKWNNKRENRDIWCKDWMKL